MKILVTGSKHELAEVIKTNKGTKIIMLKNKTLLITGGTGSFGNAAIKSFLNTGIKEIRIFSRDEKKQDDMRKEYADSKLKFYIGNVREESSLGMQWYYFNHELH